MSKDQFPGWHGTTIIGVKKDGKVVIAGDGQVSLGQTVIKGTARQVRRLSPGGFEVVAGFAGSTADAFTLLERLESKTRSDTGPTAPRGMLNWLKIGAQTNISKTRSNADCYGRNPSYGHHWCWGCLEPEHDVAAIGSGGNYAWRPRGMMEMIKTRKPLRAVRWPLQPIFVFTQTAS